MLNARKQAGSSGSGSHTSIVDAAVGKGSIGWPVPFAEFDSSLGLTDESSGVYSHPLPSMMGPAIDFDFNDVSALVHSDEINGAGGDEARTALLQLKQADEAKYWETMQRVGWAAVEVQSTFLKALSGTSL